MRAPVIFGGLAVFSLAAAGLALPALAQNIYISQLYNQVLENGDIMGPGYALESFGVQRMLPESVLRIPVEVPTNTALTIMGDCDEDCVDMNLTAYDENGRKLAEDVLDDNFPVVNVEAGDMPRIEIEIDMVDCAAAYCYAAYSVFAAGL